MKSMRLSNYFMLVKPEYMYIKITPHKSIRNYNSTNIVKAIAHTYKTLNRRIYREQKMIFFETNFKISYVIDIKNNDVNFYFIVPKPFINILLEKIKEIWSKATIEILESIEPLSKQNSTYQLVYSKEDALSLQVDKKSNEPLNSILNVIEIMKNDDRVTIIYNFLPRNQFGWMKQYGDTIEKIKNKKPVDREKVNITYISKAVLTYLVSLMDSILDVLIDFTGGQKKKQGLSFTESLATALEKVQEISPATKRKKELNVIDTQIAVVSKSEDITRQENNAISVCQSYRVLDEDNELSYKKVKSSIDFEKYRFDNIEVNTISTDEGQNFVQIPGRQLLRDFNIKHIKTEETQVPSKLSQGYISLGSCTYKGLSQLAYLEDDYDIGNLPLTIIGSQGSGKTTYIKNIANFCSKNNEGIFLLDFIKNCELSNAIAKVIPKEKLVILNLADEKDIQGLGYNEICINDKMTTYEKLNLANLQSQQVMALVDAISVGEPLSSRMRRFLNSACNVVFSQGNASIKDVISCLENFRRRQEYINGLSDELKIFLTDDILTLQELDEYSKVTKDNPVAEIVGTKENKIEYILDRVSMLREDFKLKYMYNKSIKDNINLIECMEQGKVTLIQMKESDFPTKMIKNILITYWISKIWLTSQLRGSVHDKPLRTNVIIDEIFQAPTCMNTLEYILPQSRKFGCKFILSTQYIKQLENIFDTLEASGSSYMLLKGCMEDDFNHFKSKFEGYEYEDLRDMAQYSSLNLVYYSDGYAKFITKLPKPI